MCKNMRKFTNSDFMKLLIHVYNSGYHAGHHYTVEGGYVDVHPNDMDSYHEEEVKELVSELGGMNTLNWGE